MAAAPHLQLRAYVEYLRDMGVYDLYRRPAPSVALPESLRELLAQAARAGGALPRSVARAVPGADPGSRAPIPSSAAPLRGAVAASRAVSESIARPVADAASRVAEGESPFLPPEFIAAMPKPRSFDELAPPSTDIVLPADRAAALAALRAEIGDCTRCPLAYAGRRTIVFADGDPNARLMFVGEGPGVDEDMSGTPFVGKAGQLLNNMIGAMGLKREEVYIANIVMCRPPANRPPEFLEATTCSPFLLRQIDIVRPAVIVALGATAATYLLGVKQSLASLRGAWHSARGAKVAVTYHPAFLLRDPRQKGEAWKDLQRVMAELGLEKPAAGSKD